MNIALVSQEYPPVTAKGGIGTQTRMKAEGLASIGHRVFVISRSPDGDHHEHTEGLITVIRFPGMEQDMPHMTDAVSWLSHSLLVATAVERLDAAVGLDIIDFPEWGAEGYAYLLNRNEWHGVTSVIHLHGPLVMFNKVIGWPETDSPFYKTGFHMESTAVSMADGVYSSSACSADWVRRHYDNRRLEIPVIHTGIDLDRFQPMDVRKEERPTILFAGKIVPNKGVEELVDAACILAVTVPRLRLRFAGRGDASYLDRLRKRAVEKGCNGLLEFLDFVPTEHMPMELSKAHLFAAPSHYEGGPGFVYLEAMACGLPVVACSGSGVSEIVDQGVNGMLVPPRDSGSLAAAMHGILTNPDTLARMSEEARTYVIRHADARTKVREIEAYYRSVIADKKDNGFYPGEPQTSIACAAYSS
jgi:glycogen(starch) synthase